MKPIDKLYKLKTNIQNDLTTDVTWNRVARLSAKGARALPRASAEYALDKFPIIGWLPRYNYRWLVNDVIAGLTLGLMLIPQGLSYAKLATIPVQYGLMSSWLPSAIYAFMGTSKDLSTGPTSLIGLLTSEVIEQLREDRWTPSEIASAVAMMMGIYGLVIGMLKLGFLLEFISLPILSGFISAVAITIILNQMQSLLGEPAVGDGAARQIHDILKNLPRANGYACAVGFTGILLLTILDRAGKKWGKKNRVIWFLSITRAFIALVLYTGISYAVNRSRGDGNFLFDVAKVKADGLELPPRVPSGSLLSKVAGPSIAVFIGSAVEHTAIARGFGVHNNYVTDQSQELTYYGVTNIFNSFFHSMGVGGAISRTAVNSACNVKSPLSGFITTAVVLVSIFKLVGTLYWIPKATLAAIIITAVWPLIYPPSTFYRWWKTSLADFVSSMIAFWVSLFVSTELGIACSVGFNIVYLLLRQIFERVSTTPETRSELAVVLEEAQKLPPRGASIPADTRTFTFADSVYFSNSYRVKTSVLDTIQTHHAPVFNSAFAPEAERNWSVTGERRVAKLRRAAGIRDPSSLPPIGMVVLDFGSVSHVDATACSHFKDLIREVKKYGGERVEFRFVGMSSYVRERFERAGWCLLEGSEEEMRSHQEDAAGKDRAGLVVRVYPNVALAVVSPRNGRTRSVEEIHDMMGEKKSHDNSDNGAAASYREEV